MKRITGGIKSSGTVGIAQLIRSYIRENKLKQGDRLPTHEELSRKLGIGTRKLREGLSILEQEGLIVTMRKGGTRISSPSLDYLDIPISWHLDGHGCTLYDLVHARAVLEGAIASEAAKRRKARDLLVMLDSIEQMEEQMESGEYESEDGIDPDETFHLAVLYSTHNPAMKVFGELIHSQFVIYNQEHFTSSRQNQSITINQHRKILTAIEERVPDLAREEMQAHIKHQIKSKTPAQRNSKIYGSKMH